MARTTRGDAGHESDWVRDRRVSWRWPVAFGVVGVGWLAIPDPWGALVAAAGFAAAGALCVGNALRCQRTHCAITGPLYLVAAFLFVARAGGVSVSASSIVAVAVVGTVMAFVPERLGTRYLGAAGASTLATTGTFLAAGLAAACCAGPALFVLFGLSIAGLGALAALEPYRPLLLAAGLGCWLVAHRQRQGATIACWDETCGSPTTQRLSGILLWGSLAALAVAAVYPYVIPLMVYED